MMNELWTCFCCERENNRKTHRGPDEKPVCHDCFRYVFSPISCGSCGKTFRWLAGAAPALCGACRPRRTCIACAKQLVCAWRQLPTGVLCRSCNDRIEYTVCREDLEREFARLHRDQLREESKQAIVDLLDDLAPIDAMRAAWRLPVWVRSAQSLEVLLPTYSEMTEIVAAERLGVEGLKRHQDVYWKLVARDVLPAVQKETIEYLLLRGRLYERLKEVKAAWARPVLEAFAEALRRCVRRGRKPAHEYFRMKFKPSTAVLYFNWACRFADHVHAEGVRRFKDVTPQHVDAFYKVHKGARNIMGPFLAFLDKREQRSSRLTPQPQARKVVRAMSDEERVRWIRIWLDARGDDTRVAFAGLMVGLYASKLTDLCGVRLDEIHTVGDTRRITYGQNTLELDPRVAQVLHRWLAFRAAHFRNVHSPFLFPARREGGHMKCFSLNKWFQKLQIPVDRLYSASLLAALREPYAQPKLLVDQFGVSATTAHSAYGAINPVARDGADLFTNPHCDEEPMCDQ